MVRHPWVLAATLLAFGTIAWVLLAEPPRKTDLGLETSHSLNGEPDLRLISERSPYMRTER
jgi:hypothetical protein